MQQPANASLRLLSVLGRGSFGEVHIAERTTPGGLRGRVAVKLLPAGLRPDDPAVRRLRDEAAMLAALRHTAILAVHDLVEIDGRVGLVTELIDGEDLHDCIYGPDPIGPRALVQAIEHVAEALDSAWSAAGSSGAPLRVVHRDIKPTNLRVSARGELKVLDFGVARANLEGRAASTGGATVLGSVAYMAPERLRPDGVADEPSSDVFSVGCVLFEGFARERLFADVDVPRALALAADSEAHAAYVERRIAQLTGVPAEVRDLLRLMLATDRARRPSHVQVVAACERLAVSLDGPSLRAWARAREWREIDVAGGESRSGAADTFDGDLGLEPDASSAEGSSGATAGGAERWEPVERLAERGPQAWWRVRDRRTGAWATAKIVRGAGVDGRKRAERHEREARILRETDHPGLPRLLDAFVVGRGEGAAWWLVTTPVDGPTLSEELERRRYDEADVLGILEEVAEILAYLHTRQPPIIHRDLRPENFRRGSDGRLVLVDLGSALDHVLDPDLGGSTFAGSFGYMAPEQLGGDADERSDLYGLGALGAALLTREPVHALVGADQRVDFASRVRVSGQTERLLDELLAPEPDRRPTSIVVVRDRLRALRDRPQPTAVAVPTRRRGGLAFGVAVGIAVLAMLLVFAVSFGLMGLAALGPRLMPGIGAGGPSVVAPDDEIREVSPSELVPRKRVAPRFPAAAVEGAYGDQTCTARLFIDETGAVYQAVVEGCAEPFRDETEAMFLQWRYQPFVSGGQPTRVQVELNQTYKIQTPDAGSPAGGGSPVGDGAR